VLFPTPGQITHVLLTRAPLYSEDCSPFLARLACVRHAASVDSEPGSNSQDNLMRLILFALKTELTRDLNCLCTLSIFKEPCGSQASNFGVKKTAEFAWRSFQHQYPATNLSLGTSSNYRYQCEDCQAPISLFRRRCKCTLQYCQVAETHASCGFQLSTLLITSRSSAISRSFFAASSLSIITRNKGSVPE
jgi:hypothetical protein